MKPLTTVAQVHQLTEQQATRHLPVHLKGVITAFSGWETSFFFEDRTGALAVNRWELGEPHAGDAIDLYGVTDPGKFSNSVDSQKIVVTGRGTLPKTHLYRYADLMGGQKDAAWIEVAGVVEAASVQHIWKRDVLVLALEAGGGHVTVRVLSYAPEDVNRLVDAVVRIRGVCGTEYNEKRQFTGVRVFVTDTKNIEVLDAAPTDPFAVPTSPLSIVLASGEQSSAHRRLKVTGTVTFQDPGHSLYLQDGSDAIFISTEVQTQVPLGARVEAIGFPSFSTYSPSLRYGDFRVIRQGRELAPVTAYFPNRGFVQQADTYQYVPYDGQLIQMRGMLVDSEALLNQNQWLLRDGERHVLAVLRHGSGTPPRIPLGSMVSVTGVFSVRTDEDHHPQAFRVLMRSPADLVVVRLASWWTSEHTLELLLVVLLMTLGVALWGFTLRRRVRQQTHMLRESEERFRLQAQQDALTGLASRSFLREQLDRSLQLAKHTGTKLGVLMVDLDHFKEVNDTLGHHAGDELLCVVAERVRRSVRKTDTVARMGGDEFVVLLPNIDSAAEAGLIGAKVVANVSAPAEIALREMLISASVGVCVYPDGGEDVETLLQNVDAAMYQAKAAGRNSFAIYGRPQLESSVR